MSFENFKKYISSNLISLCGYVIFFYSLFFILSYPAQYAVEKATQDFLIEDLLPSATLMTYVFIIALSYIGIIGLFIFLIFEIYLKKNGKIKSINFLKNQNKFKSFLFWLGYVLIPFPIYTFIVLFIIFLIKMSIWSFTK